MTVDNGRPIVLIHGFWVTPRRWDTGPHLLPANGLEEVADYALNWATEHAAAGGARA